MRRIFGESLERRLFVWAAMQSRREHAIRAMMLGVAGAIISMLEVVSVCVTTPLIKLFDAAIMSKKPMGREEKDKLIKELS